MPEFSRSAVRAALASVGGTLLVAGLGAFPLVAYSGLRSPPRAGVAVPAVGITDPVPPGLDAIFVEREPPWWLVDDGIRRGGAPPFDLPPDELRAAGPAAAAGMLAALEAGEGGGFLDGSGRGPPRPPVVEAAAGVPLVAAVRDVAILLRTDAGGRVRAARALRYAESDDGASPGPAAGAPRGPVPLAVGATLRREGADPFLRVRTAALLGDALSTLAFLDATGGRPVATRAQALARTGRWAEAADLLTALASGLERREEAAAVHEAEAGLRVRAGDESALLRAREDAADLGPRRPLPSLDRALTALPDLVAAGRTADAVRGVAACLEGRDARLVARSATRRRAVLAAAALALDAGEPEAASVLLRRGRVEPLAPALRTVVEALDTQARAAAERARSRPRRVVGNPPRGG